MSMAYSRFPTKVGTTVVEGQGFAETVRAPARVNEGQAGEWGPAFAKAGRVNSEILR